VLVDVALPLLVAVMLADALFVAVRVGVELQDTGVAVAVPLGDGEGVG
jgi:hypothetical protein